MTEEQKSHEKLVEQATALWRENKNKEAIVLCDEALKVDPNFANAYNIRGLIKSTLGQKEEAISDYDEAIRLNAEHANAYNNRGNAKSTLGRFEEAVMDFNESIRLQPNYAPSYSFRGSVKNTLGQHEEAIKDFSEAIRIKSNYGWAYFSRGKAKHDLGRKEEAIKDYDEAINLDPKFDIAYVNRGLAKNEIGRHEEAIKDYDATINLKPEWDFPFYFKALAYEELAKHGEAIESISNYIDRAPDDPDGFILRGRLKVELSLQEADFQRLLKEAKDDFDTAQKKLNVLPYFLGYYHAIIAAVLNKDFKKAHKQCKKSLDSGYAEANYLNFILEEIQMLEKDYEESIRNELFLALLQLALSVKKIKKKHIVGQSDAPDGIAHFTNLAALKNIIGYESGKLPDKKSGDKPKEKPNHLRMYNVAYMNDPTEGKSLLEADGILAKADATHKECLKELFPGDGNIDDHHKLFWAGKEYVICLTSFTLLVDRLDLWRGYGKDGVGFCIVTPFSAFSGEFAHGMLTSFIQEGSGPKEIKNHKQEKKEDPKSQGPAIYKILYGEEKAKESARNLQPSLRRLRDALVKLKETEQSRVRSIARALVNDIRYLYKNEEYSAEKEARIIQSYELSSGIMDETAKSLYLDEGLDDKPPRIYAKTGAFVFENAGSKIVIGPKVPDKTRVEYQLKYWLAACNYLEKTMVVVSKIPYR